MPTAIGAYPIPDVAALSSFSGRPVDSYTVWAPVALTQATLLFVLTTELTVPPDPAADQAKSLLALYAICQMADDLFLGQPYVPLKAQPFQSQTIGSYCVDYDTEILTQDGWKSGHAVRPGDTALTLNADTWQSEWEPVLAVHRFPSAPRKMLRIESQRFSSLTTLDHRWLTDKNGAPAWTTSQALATAGQNVRVPFSAPHAAPTEAKYSDALVELVAWLWTEGGWSWKGRSRGVRIHQSYRVNSGNCARIRNALNEVFGPASSSLRGETTHPAQCTGCGSPSVAMGLCKSCYMCYWASTEYAPAVRPSTWRETQPDSRSGMSVFSLSAEASDVLTRHLTYEDKAVRTEFLRSLTRAQLLLFIEVSLLADGSSPKQLCQKNRAAAEQFALACLLAGKRVSVRQGKNGMWGVTLTTSVLVSPYPIRDGVQHGVTRSLFDVIAVDGEVWCPQTPNGTWLARRNGTIYYTGNSYNKGSGAFRETPAFLKAQIGHYTGLLWWDLAVREFGSVLLTESAAITVFDRSRDLALSDAGRQVFLGPADRNQLLYPFDINAPASDFR